VRSGTPVAQDLDRFIHCGVRRRQLWSHAGIVIPKAFRARRQPWPIE
jgi:hypothetical protein